MHPQRARAVEVPRDEQCAFVGGAGEDLVEAAGRLPGVQAGIAVMAGGDDLHGLCTRSPTKTARSPPDTSRATDEPGVCPGADSSVRKSLTRWVPSQSRDCPAR